MITKVMERPIKGIMILKDKHRDSFLVPRKNIDQSANTKVLATGVQQYNNVLPQSLSTKLNTKKIEVIVPGGESNDRDTNLNRNYTKQTEAIARIYMQDTSHMHQTPVQHLGYRWLVQHERRAIWRVPWMGWNFTDSQFTRVENSFRSLEDAIEYCKFCGFGYHVTYPNWRYSSKQIYSDNFKWKGFPKDDDPDQ